MIKKTSFYTRHEGLILGGSAVLVVVAFWEYAWSQKWISPLFFSGPSSIARQFWTDLTGPEATLTADMLFSGKNFALGLALAILAGVIVGVIIGWYRRVRLIFEPFLNALYATPRIAMVPLIIIWFGIDWKSKVFIVFMSAFFPILVNTVAGIRTLDPDLLRAARAFCASDWQIFKTLAVPGSVPFILTGIRQGVALGLIGVVVGEMFGGSEGVGFRVAYGGQTFQTDTVFVGVLIVASSGMLLTFLTERLDADSRDGARSVEMAEIVLGIGTSHGPLLSTPPEQWHLRAQADRENKQHYYRGRTYDYESLLRERAPGFAAEIELDTRRERYWCCQRGLDAVGAKFKSVAPDALVIVGNDQREFFTDELTPAITIFCAKEIPNNPLTLPELTPGLAIAEQGNCPPGGAVYPGLPELADHITESLVEQGFDPAQSTKIPKTAYRQGIPHAYGFVYHRVMGDMPPPSVPIIFNVHYPHNRPRLRRCIALGHALKTAIETFQGYGRIALLASGGLTHFVIDEEMDHAVLNAMQTGDEDALCAYPENYFQSGTAEIKNWLTVIGAMNAAGKRFHLIDYVPCYRSEAGTGNAMAFVYWE